MSNCDQFRDWFEAYALGALDAPERAQLDAHLATNCAECARAVEEARWLVSQLAYLAPENAPSDMLKGRFMQMVRAEANSTKHVVAEPKSSTPWWMWAAVAALLILAVLAERETLQLRKELRAAENQAALYRQGISDVEVKLKMAERENVILTDSASVKIKLAEAGPQQPRVDAIWHAKLGIVLTAENIPAPASGRVLQLWLIPKEPGGKPLPSETVRPDENGKFILVVASPPEAMTDTKALAFTDEPEGGSTQPTTAPKWVGATTASR